MSEKANADERRFEAQDLLELLDEVGVKVFLEGGQFVRLRAARGKLSADLAWRVKRLEPELAELLRAKAERMAERIRNGAVE
jgi:hypothetical protein